MDRDPSTAKRTAGADWRDLQEELWMVIFNHMQTMERAALRQACKNRKLMVDKISVKLAPKEVRALTSWPHLHTVSLRRVPQTPQSHQRVPAVLPGVLLAARELRSIVVPFCLWPKLLGDGSDLYPLESLTLDAAAYTKKQLMSLAVLDWLFSDLDVVRLHVKRVVFDTPAGFTGEVVSFDNPFLTNLTLEGCQHVPWCLLEPLKLTHLQLHCLTGGDDTLGIFLSQLGLLTTLQHLEIVLSGKCATEAVKEEQWQPLATLQLTHLSLVEMPQLTDTVLPMLLRMTSLAGLDVRGSKVSSAGLRGLSNLKELHHLAALCLASDEAATRRLFLYHTQLTHLDVSLPGCGQQSRGAAAQLVLRASCSPGPQKGQARCFFRPEG
ncbi:hypothetical protein WJX73_002367 [Symbiochloris irregularis]|uniref:Uncharacterized protein n=1 Tax=Symbiochloris irregularis TaxID=706552 RepID=A0AAW1NRM5_9CHLO